MRVIILFLYIENGIVASKRLVGGYCLSVVVNRLVIQSVCLALEYVLKRVEFEESRLINLSNLFNV